MINRIEKFIKVTDDWYPTFENNTVKLILMHQVYNKTDMVRICVWGADDFGLEMDFNGTSEENVLKFNEWKETIYDVIPEFTHIDYFRSLGFYNA